MNKLVILDHRTEITYVIPYDFNVFEDAMVCIKEYSEKNNLGMSIDYCSWMEVEKFELVIEKDETEELKVGSVLIAIDPCRMEDDDLPTLTVGKEYVVKSMMFEKIYITDDDNSPHSFNLEGHENWKNFFVLKT